jgi:hypothetical protein
VSDPGYSIDIGEMVVEHGPTNVDDFTRQVEVELRRLLGGAAETTPAPAETNAQRIARMVHAELRDRSTR